MSGAFSRAFAQGRASPPINASQVPVNRRTPYHYEVRFAAQTRIIWMLSAALTFSLLAFGVVFIAADRTRRFDITPYVADGSVFGCQPIVVRTVEPEGLL
ncbi:hypothetical protein [Microvirga puerhi]|uniref:Uncharacterized protein n=1 Tax=Microvirga puerhi TaxID=2876078 RepID=A0ABS7VVP3_9HYPH|nr:hypothetical protein [Microvirga puerhi]MBZ6078938.1 hypothetical protein [Microvirga puerhi]